MKRSKPSSPRSASRRKSTPKLALVTPHKNHRVDVALIRRIYRLLDPVSRRYFRHEVRGLENIPGGATLLVANHSGGKIPVDALLFAHAWYGHFDFERPLFSLVHDFLFKMSPWVSRGLARLGCLRAHRAHAKDLFSQEESVLVLPGGAHETFRPWHERNRIDFGNHMGFVRVALEHRVPITPIVAVGGHETFFIVARGERAARFLGLKRVFRASTFPLILGVPFGLYVGPVPAPFPLPAKIVHQVLPPIHLDRAEAGHAAYRPRDAHDRRKVREIYDYVVAEMQQALTALAAERRLPVIG